MVSAILSRIVILVFGTLYPAYASYKAVRTKNVKEYVKWMMYWIVFALFSAGETFFDVFLSWLPFYYELKIVFVVWMLSPMTQGSSFLFKKFVHPHLAKREKEIDEMIAQASKQGYSTLLSLGTKGISYASQFMMRTAIMGQSKLVDHLRRSYSTSDLSNDGHALLQRHDASGQEEGEDELDNRLREDNAELEVRASGNKGKLGRSKSAASASSYSLSSVKEETEGDGDEEEKIITETYTVPAKRHYSLKEDNQAGERRMRIKSLSPPISGLSQVISPQKTRDAVNVKLQYSVKEPLKSLSAYDDSKNTAPVPRIVELKRNLFTRSHSQDNIIIKRGKVQVLKGLSDERKRRLLQRAQSEELSVARQADWKRPVSTLASHAEQENSRLIRYANESVNRDDAFETSEYYSPEDRKLKNPHSLQFEESAWTTVDQGPTVMIRSSPDRLSTSLSTGAERNDQSLEPETSEWHLVDETDELITDIDIPGSDILFIDADEDPAFEIREDSYSGAQTIDVSSLPFCDFIEEDNTLNLPETLYASEMSDSDEDEINSFSDSCETLRSSPSENESVGLMGIDEETSPDNSAHLKSKSLERVLETVLSERTSHESGCQSLPGSPSISRGPLFEDIEEEYQQSVSTPNSPFSEPKYSQPSSRSSVAKPRRSQRIPGRYPLIRQARESPAISPPRTFDPFRSWTSRSQPSSSSPGSSAPISISAPLLSHGQPMERLYMRSQSVDSKDSWYHTYPRSRIVTNRGSPARGQSRSRSVSFERDSLPIYRFRQLSQDPKLMSLKPE